MHFRRLVFAGAVLGLTLVPGHAVAQSGAKWTPARTADGQPDLQGVWANNNATPLERPKELAGRALLTEQEVAALRQKAGDLFKGQSDAAFGDTLFLSVLANVQGTKSGFTSTDGQTGDYNSVWLVDRDFDSRTSLITDPPDGRLPAMTPQGQEKQLAAAARRNRPAEGPEDRSLSERCITFGSPRLQAGYNSYFHIAQSAKTVVIVMETIHDARIIPLDGSPHLPSNVRTWLGDSRGHWEGDTLVVDTTNYKPGVFMNVSTDQLHVIEKFTRAGSDVLKWEITVDDPGAWSKPWSAMIPLRHSNDAIYEYACHEGNSGLEGILSGARADEKTKESANRN